DKEVTVFIVAQPMQVSLAAPSTLFGVGAAAVQTNRTWDFVRNSPGGRVCMSKADDAGVVAPIAPPATAETAPAQLPQIFAFRTIAGGGEVFGSCLTQSRGNFATGGACT